MDHPIYLKEKAECWMHGLTDCWTYVEGHEISCFSTKEAWEVPFPEQGKKHIMCLECLKADIWKLLLIGNVKKSILTRIR